MREKTLCLNHIQYSYKVLQLIILSNVYTQKAKIWIGFYKSTIFYKINQKYIIIIIINVGTIFLCYVVTIILHRLWFAVSIYSSKLYLIKNIIL